MEELINEDKEAEGFDSSAFDMKCPYCEFPTTPINKTCDVCGFKLDNNMALTAAIVEEIEDELRENIKEMKKDGLSDAEIIDITEEFVDEMSAGSPHDEEIKTMLLELVESELKK